MLVKRLKQANGCGMIVSTLHGQYVSLDTPQIWEKRSSLCCANSNQDFTRSHNLSKDFYLTSAQCQCTIFLPWCHAIVVSWLLGILIRRIDSIPIEGNKVPPPLCASPCQSPPTNNPISNQAAFFPRAVANPFQVVWNCPLTSRNLDPRTQTRDHFRSFFLPLRFPDITTRLTDSERQNVENELSLVLQRMPWRKRKGEALKLVKMCGWLENALSNVRLRLFH